MQTYFDSSALVPLLLLRSRFHSSARAALEMAGTETVTSTHALAEAYRTLTSLTPDPLSPKAARDLVRSLDKVMSILPLTREIYDRAISVTAGQGLSGPIVYDALHCCAAQQFKVRQILTRNAKHLRLFAGSLSVVELVADSHPDQ